MAYLILSLIMSMLLPLLIAEAVVLGIAAIVGAIAGVTVPYVLIAGITAGVIVLYYGYRIIMVALAYKGMMGEIEKIENEERSRLDDFLDL